MPMKEMVGWFEIKKLSIMDTIIVQSFTSSREQQIISLKTFLNKFTSSTYKIVKNVELGYFMGFVVFSLTQPLYCRGCHCWPGMEE
ncbi:hypothetical protein Glove_493g40 [Diversispora epigaea]|uniref:Uncharacterized protein n=1 Tax=Diversispora epigaea TaxID=1348612 RepID=A0A397GNU5_9GLOM|nr:hypothetical protein Glove_493g40 [Diversispora epigaea]